MNFSMKDFFSKCDQIRRKLRIWSHLLKKSIIENFIFCVVPTQNIAPDLKFLSTTVWYCTKIYFTEIKAFQKLWKMLFISSRKFFFRFSKDSYFYSCFFFPSTFSRFNKSNETEIIMTSWIGLLKLANVIFGTTQKTLCIKSSKLCKL